MRKIIVLLFLVISFIIIWAAGGQFRTTGIGSTKREALMVAQRKAVEKIVGVLVDSQSLSKNLMLVENKILSISRGYVKSYTIISERKQKDGNWKVVLECKMAEKRIKNSLKALGILRDKMGNPRIMVIYQPVITSDVPQEFHSLASEVYEGIIKYLMEREFPVVGNRIIHQSILQEFVYSKKFYKKVVELGLRMKADYILLYNIIPVEQESTNTYKKGLVMISTKIINTLSGQILANQNKKIMGMDKDSIDLAFRKATRKAGKFAAVFLEKKLVKAWVAATVSGRVVVLEMVNIADFSLLVKFKTQLKTSYGVRDIILKNSTSNAVVYEIIYIGDIDNLKKDVHSILKKMGLKAKVHLSCGNWIRIELPINSQNKTKELQNKSEEIPERFRCMKH